MAIFARASLVGALALLAAAAALPGALAAQTVRGMVTEGTTGAPIPGVVVLLLNQADNAARRGMTDEKGEYAVVAPGSGRYRLRAMRIGFRPTTSDAIDVILGLNEVPPLRLIGIPISLDTIRVASRSVCGGQRDDGFAAIWDQARTALTAAQLTAASRGITATVVTYERTLDPRTRRVQSQSADVATGFVTQPWQSAPAAVLRRDGYVVTDEAGWVTYHAPGLAVLTSDAFLEDHCFRVSRTRDGRVAVAFEPTRERREIPDIRGTLLLDARTAELQRLEYRYVNVSSAQENEAGGEMAFARMRDGGWAISGWNIRMPTLEQEVIGGRPVLRVSDIRVAGGDLSLALRGTDTLWSRSAVTLAGTVVDSASGRALTGARVVLRGTPLATETGVGGAFQLRDVLPGEYTLEVRTAQLDALGVTQQMPVLVTESAAGLQIRVGRPTTRFAVFSGVVVTDSAQQPIVEAHVSLPDLERAVYTDSTGTFRLEDVPPGEHRIVVRRLGFGPLDTKLVFAPDQSLERRILLQSVATLDTVTVVGRSLIPTFDEHRAQRLGQFLTREDLEKQSGRRMSEVLAKFRGVRIISNEGRVFIATSRRSTQAYRPLEPSEGNYALVPVQGFCLSRIYVNGTLVFQPRPGETPLDINSFLPDQIEAIEYYETQAQVPLRYSGGDTNCGVLVIHTRRVRR